MNLYSIDAGHFKLDGGAMFGVVPKSLWNRQISADENNLIRLTMRCLLVEDGKNLILIDTGMGDKQEARWQGYYYRHGDGDLIKSIEKAGFSANEITDVVCSHLHFDHCGGAVQWNTARDAFVLTFPNARYWSNSLHWDAATKPNAREKASFLKENILPIQESGQLMFYDQVEKPFLNLDMRLANGHTEQMMMPEISYNGKKIIFMADLIPTHAHVPIPWVMGYDVRPLESMTEKEKFLKEAADNQYILFFDHDPIYDCCTVEMTEKGIRVAQVGKLADLL